MNDTLYIAAIIVICMAVTFSLRLVPFILFGGKKAMPPVVKRLSDELPSAMIAVLVVYCLKSGFSGGTVTLISALASVAIVVATYLWKRQLLISVAGGTAAYMTLIRLLPLLI